MLDLAKQYHKTCIWVYVLHMTTNHSNTDEICNDLFWKKTLSSLFYHKNLQVLSLFRLMHLFQVFATKSICNPLLKDKT